LFFFSSRRRHTRFSRDWSSDVCSSDLELTKLARFYDDDRMWDRVFNRRVGKNSLKGLLAGAALGATVVGPLSAAVLKKQYGEEEIGRASCRERVEGGGVEGPAEQTRRE